MFTLHCKPLYTPTDITPPNAYPTLARLHRHTYQTYLIIKPIPWGKSDRADKYYRFDWRGLPRGSAHPGIIAISPVIVADPVLWPSVIRIPGHAHCKRPFGIKPSFFTKRQDLSVRRA